MKNTERDVVARRMVKRRVEVMGTTGFAVARGSFRLDRVAHRRPPFVIFVSFVVIINTFAFHPEPGNRDHQSRGVSRARSASVRRFSISIDPPTLAITIRINVLVTTGAAIRETGFSRNDSAMKVANAAHA